MPPRSLDLDAFAQEGTLQATERETLTPTSHKTLNLQSVLPAIRTGAMVAHNLWEWPTNVCFNLRTLGGLFFSEEGVDVGERDEGRRAGGNGGRENCSSDVFYERTIYFQQQQNNNKKNTNKIWKNKIIMMHREGEKVPQELYSFHFFLW